MDDLNPTQRLNAAERFFFDHAGYSWDPRKEAKAAGKTRCAVALREAEEAFSDAEAYASVAFRVKPDECGCDPDDDNPGPRWSMWIEDAEGHVLNSLHGIDDDGPTYSRVVRAELALEVLEELRALVAAERVEG